MFPVDSLEKSGSTDKSKQIDTSDERKAFDTFDGEEEKIDSGKTGDPDSEDETEETEEESEELGKGEDKESEEENEDDEVEESLENDNLYQQIKARDAKILKDIPGLKHTIFREQRFTELYPTVEEAEEAKEGYQVFQQFQDDIASGNSEKMLAALEQLGKENLQGFVGNFLPTLEKQSKDLYLETLYPEFKKLFRAAKRSNDENLRNAADHFHNYVFGDVEFGKEVGITPKKADEKEDKISQREREFEERQLKSFSKDIEFNAVGRAKRIIGKAFEGSGLSPLLQKSLTEEIYKRVDTEVIKDIRHMGNMSNLWKRARANGFTSESKDSIVNAYLSRAKLLIPKMRQRVLAEAKLDVKGVEIKKLTTRIPASSSVSTVGVNSGKKIDIKKIDMSGENAERDLLDGKVTYKK